MNNFSTLLKNKKIVVLASFTLLLIIASIIISIASQSKQNTTNITNEQSNVMTNQVDNPQTNSNNIPQGNTRQIQPTAKIESPNTPAKSINEFAIKDWILSDNDVYTFQYPTDWKLQRTLFPNGQTVTVVPENATYTPATPTWSITITKTDLTNPITNKEKLYLSVGFKQETTDISGQKAEVVSGVFPNANANNAVQETNIYLARDNYSYVVSYKYPGNKINQQYEQLFQKITNTISIEY
jgi:hypothetical protein